MQYNTINLTLVEITQSGCPKDLLSVSCLYNYKSILSNNRINLYLYIDDIILIESAFFYKSNFPEINHTNCELKLRDRQV